MERRIVVVQPALPTYRYDFFEKLHDAYSGAFLVVYSPASLDVLTSAQVSAPWAAPVGKIVDLPCGLNWQPGIWQLPLTRNDIVVLSGAPRTLSNLVLLIRARLRGTRVVWWGHLWSATTKPWRFAVRMLIAKMSNALLFYTDEEVTQFRRGPGSSDQRPIGALNNGLNVEEIRNWAAPYSASDRPKHILLIGRLTDKAEITLLLDALSHDSCQEVVLEVVGGGPMTQELQTQAASQGLASRVVWHGGITDEAVIARVANRCRAFVYPGQVGLSLIHAMAYGLPSIIKSGGRANGPETAAFTPQETGLSFAGGNARDLAQTISTLINDEERLNSMARKAYSVTDASFNTKDMVRRFKEFIDAI